MIDVNTATGRSEFVRKALRVAVAEINASAAQLPPPPPSLAGRSVTVMVVVLNDATQARLVTQNVDDGRGGTRLVRMPDLNLLTSPVRVEGTAVCLRFGPGVHAEIVTEVVSETNASAFMAFDTFVCLTLGYTSRRLPDGSVEKEPFDLARGFLRGVVDGPNVETLLPEMAQLGDALVLVRRRLDSLRAQATAGIAPPEAAAELATPGPRRITPVPGSSGQESGA